MMDQWSCILSRCCCQCHCFIIIIVDQQLIQVMSYADCYPGISSNTDVICTIYKLLESSRHTCQVNHQAISTQYHFSPFILVPLICLSVSPPSPPFGTPDAEADWGPCFNSNLPPRRGRTERCGRGRRARI